MGCNFFVREWICRGYSLLLGAALVAFVNSALFSQDNSAEEGFTPALNATARPNPFIFPWGDSYAQLRGAANRGVIIREKSGSFLSFRRENLEYQYRFFLKEKIKEIVLKREESSSQSDEADSSAPWLFSRLLLEPESEPEQARLYAVEILLPPLLFDGAGGEEFKNNLGLLYGTPREKNENLIEIENETTLVHIYLTTFQKKRYLVRLTFVGRELVDERNRYMKNREREFEKAIRKRVRDANRSRR